MILNLKQISQSHILNYNYIMSEKIIDLNFVHRNPTFYTGMT